VFFDNREGIALVNGRLIQQVSLVQKSKTKFVGEPLWLAILQ
jgi:hypothetical protein